jgi:hypothetical protein
MKELKFLYETTVLKQVEEKVTETKEDNGQKIEVTRSVRKAKPIKVAILKAGRKLFEGAERFYAIQIADNIRAGLLPYSLVAKRYANDGGPLSEPEKEKVEELKNQIKALEKEFFALIGTEANQIDRRSDLLVEINKLTVELNEIQNSYADIFENTAEMKARNKAMEWWALHLSYIDEDGKGYKPIFGDGDYAAKFIKYDELSESEDTFILEVIKKLSYLISFWFTTKSTLTNDDFKSMEKIYEDRYSTYKVEEDEVPIVKVEEPTPAS